MMAWCLSGDRPLSEPVMLSLPTHIYVCITGPHWVNYAIIGSDNGLPPVVSTNAGLLLIGPLATNFKEIKSKYIDFRSRKYI